ncbi:MAG: type IV pilus modification protein PilV [Pseudomonadota bacterium]
MMIIKGLRHNVKLRIQSSGFTLIEVLVAMLITSFGLLGIAGLVVTSLRYNQTAWQRSVATQLATDMMDRMRANSFAVVNDTGAIQSDYMKSSVNVASTAPSVYCTSFNAINNPSCTPTQIAASDLYDWKKSITSQLPGGQGLIQWASGASRQIQITLTWKEAGKSDQSWGSTMESMVSSTTGFNTCPTNGTAGLVIDSTVRCFQITFYP